jgi:hypothetical protein
MLPGKFAREWPIVVCHWPVDIKYILATAPAPGDAFFRGFLKQLAIWITFLKIYFRNSIISLYYKIFVRGFPLNKYQSKPITAAHQNLVRQSLRTLFSAVSPLSWSLVSILVST